jgi:hypothetical protein
LVDWVLIIDLNYWKFTATPCAHFGVCVHQDVVPLKRRDDGRKAFDASSYSGVVETVGVVVGVDYD